MTRWQIKLLTGHLNKVTRTAVRGGGADGKGDLLRDLDTPSRRMHLDDRGDDLAGKDRGLYAAGPSLDGIDPVVVLL